MLPYKLNIKSHYIYTHERLQIFHRWISYAFFALALLYTFPFVAYHFRFHDMEEHFSGSLMFYWSCYPSMAYFCISQYNPASNNGNSMDTKNITDLIHRNLVYEFFKITHFLGVVIFMIKFIWHCGNDTVEVPSDKFILHSCRYLFN
jgi:hypothetical protein